MNSELYNIGVLGNGHLYAMPMPSADYLNLALTQLRQTGIDSLVCLQETKESQELGLANEQSACETAGITFRRLAIPDFGVPRLTQLQPLIESLVQDLNSGANVAIHCRGGIGRTGLVCSCILVAFGMDTDSATKRVSDKRGCAVPETDAQLAMIEQFAQTIKR